MGVVTIFPSRSDVLDHVYSPMRWEVFEGLPKERLGVVIAIYWHVVLLVLPERQLASFEK